jgi:hypothetical protein
LLPFYFPFEILYLSIYAPDVYQVITLLTKSLMFTTPQP